MIKVSKDSAVIQHFMVVPYITVLLQTDVKDDVESLMMPKNQ